MNDAVRLSRTAKFVHLILLRPFVRVFSGINIRGREHLKGLDRYMIIANHNSHLDTMLLFYLLPIDHIRRTHPVADKLHFSRVRFIFRIVNFLFKPIWIIRGQPDSREGGLPQVKRALHEGHNVIIFPEGTRGAPGEMQHFKSGIGRLIAESPDIPVVPVLLTGPERALPRANGLLLPIWNNIIVGPPLQCHGPHREITGQLEQAIGELAQSDSALRHRRKAHEVKRVPQVAILGIDGSGKSSTAKLTAQALSQSKRTCLVSDQLMFYENGQPATMQPLTTEKIRQMIGGYAKKAHSLKLYKIPKLTELLLRNRLLADVQRWYSPDIIVIDGSPLLNLLAWAVLYKGDALDPPTWSTALGILSGLDRDTKETRMVLSRFSELAHLKRLGLTHLTLPDLVVLIDATPQVACRRIESRGEPRQVHETEDKLSSLREAYLQVCRVVQTDWHVPTMIIDGDRPLKEVSRDVLLFIDESDRTENT